MIQLSNEELAIAEKILSIILAYFTLKNRRELNIAYGKIRELQGQGPGKVRSWKPRLFKRRGKT